MCGRIACNLCPEEYRRACSYLDEANKQYTKPSWIDTNLTFRPSNNTCPGDSTPVLVSTGNLSKTLGKEYETERCLVPMLWGMIPRWHKGNPKKHGLSTINCRIEGINSGGHSKLYGSSLKEGKRCVVICEGYYEFKTTEGGKKQPYYVYMKQKGFKVEDKGCWKNAEWSETAGWQGPEPLKLAALYDSWNGSDGEKILSYSIITMDTDETLSWLHTRTPAVLKDEYAVAEWLDTEKVSSGRAVSMLSTCSNIAWHSVSTLVNNSRHKSEDCNKPLGSTPTKPTGLQNWLKTGSMKKKSTDTEEAVECKKIKN